MGRSSSRSGVLRRVLLLLVVLVLVGAVASYFVVPEVRERVDSAVTDARRMFETWSNPGSRALDKDIVTYWLADPSGDTSPTVSVNFGETINLETATFHIGANTGEDFRHYRRPRTVEFRVPGSTAPIRLVLRDDPAAQEHPIEVDAVRTMELRIIDFHASDADGEPLVALREIEFTSRP